MQKHRSKVEAFCVVFRTKSKSFPQGKLQSQGCMWQSQTPLKGNFSSNETKINRRNCSNKKAEYGFCGYFSSLFTGLSEKPHCSDFWNLVYFLYKYQDSFICNTQKMYFSEKNDPLHGVYFPFSYIYLSVRETVLTLTALELWRLVCCVVDSCYSILTGHISG